MAQINECDICGERLTDLTRCADCDIAVIMDLLSRIQDHLRSECALDPVPYDLAKEILAINAVPLRKYLKDKEGARHVQAMKNAGRQVRELLRKEAGQKAMDEFDSKHPDPDEAAY